MPVEIIRKYTLAQTSRLSIISKITDLYNMPAKVDHVGQKGLKLESEAVLYNALDGRKNGT